MISGCESEDTQVEKVDVDTRTKIQIWNDKYKNNTNCLGTESRLEDNEDGIVSYFDLIGFWYDDLSDTKYGYSRNIYITFDDYDKAIKYQENMEELGWQDLEIKENIDDREWELIAKQESEEEFEDNVRESIYPIQDFGYECKTE